MPAPAPTAERHDPGEPVDDGMTKAEASEKIDELQEKTGRGKPARKAPARQKG